MRQTGAKIESSVEEDEETGESDLGTKISVDVIRVERNETLSEMKKTLGDADDKKVGTIFAVVSRELTKKSGDARVVCSGANEAESKDGGLSDGSIRVVREFSEGVHDLGTWV